LEDTNHKGIEGISAGYMSILALPCSRDRRKTDRGLSAEVSLRTLPMTIYGTEYRGKDYLVGEEEILSL